MPFRHCRDGCSKSVKSEVKKTVPFGKVPDSVFNLTYGKGSFTVNASPDLLYTNSVKTSTQAQQRGKKLPYIRFAAEPPRGSNPVTQSAVAKAIPLAPVFSKSRPRACPRSKFSNRPPFRASVRLWANTKYFPPWAQSRYQKPLKPDDYCSAESGMRHQLFFTNPRRLYCSIQAISLQARKTRGTCGKSLFRF